MVALVSELGWDIRLTLSRDLDGINPFIDSLKPISPEHLRRAAERLGTEEPELRRRLAECREILGWNPLEGLKADGGNVE